MHHVETAYIFSYFNDEFLAVNALELVYRYKKKAATVYNKLFQPELNCLHDFFNQAFTARVEIQHGLSYKCAIAFKCMLG